MIHHALVDHLLTHGTAPTRAILRGRVDDVDRELRALEAAHGVVLHPDGEPWIVHPFSLSPTAIWVAAGERGWWAPCVWCGLGVATLAGGRCTLHARIGGEAEDVDVEIADGHPLDPELVVHFAIRPRDAWVNVHHHCAMVLPFRSASEVERWCARHGLARGQVVPIAQVGELARAWYGRHRDRDWRKWTVPEAAAIFRSVGLVGPFWELTGDGRF